MSVDVAGLSHGSGAALFLLLALLLLPGWRGRLVSSLLLLASLLSALWFGLLAYQAVDGVPSPAVLSALEVLRSGAWLAFLLVILARLTGPRPALPLAGGLALLLCLGLLGYHLTAPSPVHGAEPTQAEGLMLLGHLVLAIAGLVLIEQVYRNARPEARWSIKFLILGIGGLFAYDFFLYADAVLFKRVDPGLWAARGAINALAVPLIAVSAARNPDWKLDIFVSRHVVFHSAAVLGAGVYLMLMAAAGYYIRQFGGTWGTALQAIFFAGAVVVLVVLMLSGEVRARAKVFLVKHFFRNKYDYREEWLRFTGTLARYEGDHQMREAVIRAIAEIVQSPGGLLWMKDETGRYVIAAEWQARPLADAIVAPEDPMVRFLTRTGWVVNLDEFRLHPDRYEALDLPGWLLGRVDAWLLVPLMQQEDLLGFVVLARPRGHAHFNWEDSDLLKTVGRQSASYLALLQTSEALAQARQFETFNRLSAFIVHDLKNVIAQLSLISDNAKRFKDNPEFVADAFDTVDSAVGRMNRMLAHLRKGSPDGADTVLIRLDALLAEVAQVRAVERPEPGVDLRVQDVRVLGDRDRLASVLAHLVQNAQEATPDDGRVVLRLDRDGDQAVIEVQDNGCGMSEEFIRERLFRPFDTTKGNAGMGIGVFESREVVRSLGGDIQVHSRPEQGSLFRITLPLEKSMGSDPIDFSSNAEINGVRLD